MNFIQNKYNSIAFFIIFIYISPFFILGQDSYILIHDMLDHHISKFKTLADSEMIFASSSSKLEMYMNAPRAAFGSEIKLVFWLYYFFDPFTAYVLNQILIRIIAFMGMYYLLKRYVYTLEKVYYIPLVSLLFALLPFYATAGLSVAGLPLITYVFLNIRNNRANSIDWLILVIFPIYSSFVFSMMFFIIFLGFFWIYDLFKKGFIKNIKLAFAIFLYVILHLIANFRLVEVFLFGADFVSHRSQMSTVGNTYGLLDAILRSGHHFLLGQYHAQSHHIVFFPFIAIIFFRNLFSSAKDNLFIFLFLINGMISLMYGFWDSSLFNSIRETISLLLPMNLNRFHVITPLIWYVLLALSIKIFLKSSLRTKSKEIVLYSIIFLTVVFSFYKSDFINEYNKNQITYKQFFAEKLFDDIKVYIGKEQSSYKVVSIGIHPSITRYNNFYNLDGYLTNYDLQFKQQFRQIIASELEKNNSIKSYFDNWGSRCYVFIDEIGTNFVRKKNQVYPVNININSSALYNMGGRYIFSSYEIINFENNNLEFINKFEDNDSAWDIYLYQVEGA